MLEKEAGPVDEEAQCGGSLYETSVMAGSNIVICGTTVTNSHSQKLANMWMV